MRHPARSIGLLVTGLLALSACTSGSDGEAAVAVPSGEVDVALIASAADEVVDASTGRFAFTMAYEDLPGLDGVTIAGDGEYDLDDAATRIVVDLGEAFGAFDGDGGLPPGFDGSFETITIGTTLYLGGAVSSAIPGVDAEWIRVDAAELAEQAGLGDLGLDSLTTGQGVDPGAQLEQLRALGSIEAVGTEDVRGVPTTRYAGEIRLGDAFAQLDETQREAIAGLYGGDLEAVADRRVPFEVWVDDDELVRRVSQRVDLAEMAPTDGHDGDGGGGFEGTATVTIEYFDIGEDITVAAPAGAVDLLDALGGDLFGLDDDGPHATEN